MSEMTFYLNALIITTAALAALLALVSLLIYVLRPLARRSAVSTDFEQVGREATVVKTIRPGKPGQIRYLTANGPRTAYARADTIIRNGHQVLILSVAQHHFRVRRLTEAERKALQAEQATQGAVVLPDYAGENEPLVHDDPHTQAAPDAEADR